MKYVVTIFLVCFIFDGVIGRDSQLNTQSYSFRVAGRVVFKKGESKRGATVYVMWRGPIQGRIPWVHANRDGTFEIGFTRVAEAYHVCAHAGQTKGLLPLVRTPEEGRKMRDRLVCSDEFPLDEQRLEKRDIVLKLK